jgi:hypothetical protein
MIKLMKRIHRTTHKIALGLLTVSSLLLMSPMTFAASEQGIEFSEAQLDQMLAPIALYPDTILSQVLIASTYPLEIVQADRWVRSNSDLKAEDALKFVEDKDWDPSVKALVAFPDILKRMSDDVDWTQRLGDAFLSDEASVMDTVQKLRNRAYATGNLDKSDYIRVQRDDNTIVIEPAQERVVYVPVYDTRVVYGNWWWPKYPPVYWHSSNYHYTSGFYWGNRIYVGPSYYSSSLHWRDRRVVVIDRHEPRYVDRPFYTGGSIVRYEGSREWHHNPIHRRGIAYHNNDLRNTYGSRHESYERDHKYREQHRDTQRIEQPHRVDMGTRIFNNQEHNNAGRDHNDSRLNGNQWNNDRQQNTTNRTHDLQSADRAKELRERMNRNNEQNNWRTEQRHGESIQLKRGPIQSQSSDYIKRAIMQQQEQRAERRIEPVQVGQSRESESNRRTFQQRPNFNVPVHNTNNEQRNEAPRFHREEFQQPRVAPNAVREATRESVSDAMRGRFQRHEKDDKSQ